MMVGLMSFSFMIVLVASQVEVGLAQTLYIIMGWSRTYGNWSHQYNSWIFPIGKQVRRMLFFSNKVMKRFRPHTFYIIDQFDPLVRGKLLLIHWWNLLQHQSRKWICTLVLYIFFSLIGLYKVLYFICFCKGKYWCNF